jgi:broad specificity phosphatase PhoE
MRHSKSCSNYTRSFANNAENTDDPDVYVSQRIRDPRLSVAGASVAKGYRTQLQSRLRKNGFDVGHAMICASTLRRAQDTAYLVFGRRPIVLPHFAENGNLPENTPEGSAYAAPSWVHFIAHLSSLVKDGDSVVVVGHGSYLRSLWPRLTGAVMHRRLNNLDGILLDADIRADGLRVRSFKEIPYGHATLGIGIHGSDKCTLHDTRKIAAIRRVMRTRKQRGGNGSTGMPLAYFQDGAQMKGMFGEPTGVGLAGTSNSMVRMPLQQRGGKTRKRRQGGGFSAAIMGSFAANGIKLMPLAGYMGYKMYSNQRKRRTVRRRSLKRK